MTEQQLPPFFRVEEGAPPGTHAAFAGLTELILKHPDQAPDVFGSLGETAQDIQQLAATESGPTTLEEGYRLQLAKACGALLYEHMDDDVEMGGEIDREMFHAAEKRGARRDLLRIQRLGAFVSYTSKWALTLPGIAPPVDGSKKAA